VDGLEVLFPYEFMYPEQYAYMVELKRSLDCGGHALLEMPSGTGKTVTLLSLIVAYQLKNPSKIGKLMYCSRTLPELQKVVEELRQLFAYYKQNDPKHSCELIGLCLTSRSNLCIHPSVSIERDPRAVDSRCHAMAANHRRTQQSNRSGNGNAMEEDDEEEEEEQQLTAAATVPRTTDLEDTCSFFTNFQQAGRECMLPFGVYSLDDLKEFGHKNNLCPYFAARHALSYANVVVYSYAYLLQPKVADVVSGELPRNTCVVFDEAHNIDGVCIEALSVTMNRKALDRCSTALARLKSDVGKVRRADENKLRAEYERLVSGLRESTSSQTEHAPILANPLLPDDVLQDAMPGSIRSAEHFLSFLNRFAEYVKMRMRTADRPVEQTAVNFLKDVCSQALIARKALRYTSERLRSLLSTLEQANTHSSAFSSSGEHSALARLADFATLLGTYVRGFTVLIEPQDDRAPLPTGNAPLANPLLTFACLDASLAIKPVFSRFASVVITSGTLSPLDMYPKMLDFRPVVSASFTMTLARPCICPLIVGKGMSVC
jgi:DNA excision repair protein ERCC-2